MTSADYLELRRRRYRTRTQCGLEIGQIVRTPLGLLAHITGFSADGRVHLRYDERSDLVVLKAELVSTLADS